MWYSDAEVLGNYRDDIAALVDDAECTIAFIDADFSTGFFEEYNRVEYITALEISAIAQKLHVDSDFNVLTVYLDCPTGFTPDEIALLEKLCTRHQCCRADRDSTWLKSTQHGAIQDGFLRRHRD